MKNYYTAYTKQVSGDTYYFVKRFIVYPEIKDLEPILDGFGMHTDFKKACKLAGITEENICQQLLFEIENNTQQAKIIELNQEVAAKKKAN